MAHANRHYKARWLRAFAPASGVLRCVGSPLDDAPCAHGALVDLRDGGAGTGGEWGRAEREVGAALERLHIWTTSDRCMRRVPPVGRAAMPAGGRGRGTTGWTASHLSAVRDRGVCVCVCVC